jgi:hypothetical protein
MAANSSEKPHDLHFGKKPYGRPRTRPPVRRVTLELDEELLTDVVEAAAGASPLRVIVEAGLRLWLAQQPESRQPADTDTTHPRRERPNNESALRQ